MIKTIMLYRVYSKMFNKNNLKSKIKYKFITKEKK